MTKKITKVEIRDDNNRIKPEVERLMVEMIKEFVKDGEKEEQQIIDYLLLYFTDKWDGDFSLKMVVGDLCDENFKCKVFYSLRKENEQQN